jgi:hypothetical protein
MLNMGSNRRVCPKVIVVHGDQIYFAGFEQRRLNRSWMWKEFVLRTVFRRLKVVFVIAKAVLI